MIAIAGAWVQVARLWPLEGDFAHMKGYKMKIIEIQPETIEAFRRQWPCSGLHDVDHIVAAFADNGDLVDYDCCDELSNPIVNTWEGSDALPALLNDAQRNARMISTPPGTIGPIWKY